MKKKGFTLIELLAVIVILAIVMIIAIPQVLNVIEKSEMESYRESVELMMHTAEIQYNSDEVQGIAKAIPEEGFIYEYSTDGKDTIQTQESIDTYGYLNFKGDKPRSGSITMTKNKKFIIDNLVSKMRNGKYCAVKELDEQKVRVGKSTNMGCSVDSDEEEIVQDKKPCELEVDSGNSNILYVDSASDLYRLSQDVNNGTNYSGKTIKVRNNLDMSKAQGTCVGDFEPIGTESKPFKGTFDGGAKTISNLTINKPTSNNVGLFGYINNALIKGLIIDKFNVKGQNNVASIVGQSAPGVIRDIMVKSANIVGNTSVSGITNMPPISGNDSNNIVIKDITLNATGGTSVTIGTGYSQFYTTSIVEKANLTGTNALFTSGTGIYNSSNVLANQSSNTSAFPTSDIGDINFYESAGLDTWIGGDNDSSGYYWDYENDNSKDIVLKSVESKPIPNDIDKVLSKNSNNQYVIKNGKDWKNIAGNFLKLDKNYILENDINFSGKQFYMLGSSNNQFKGTFEGNIKTISGVKINASRVNDIGIFGKTNGARIYGLKIDNINVVGNSYVASLIGEAANGYISKVMVINAKVVGNTNVSGLVNFPPISGNGIDNVLVKNITVQGASATALGTGYEQFYVSSIVENSNVTGTNAYFTSGANRNVYYSTTALVNNTANSNAFTTSDLSRLSFYEAASLDTWIGGINDSTNYYYDYENSSSNNVVLKSNKIDPVPTNIDNVLTKSGNYYLIKNTNDWKNATVFANLSKNFKVTSNLDFTGKHYYMFGSYFNQFKGTFDGGAHTISNISISANRVNNIGVFGYANIATILGTNFNNINMIGNAYVGTIVGQSAPCALKEVSINNSSVTGNSSVGGVVGYLPPISENELSNTLIKKVTINSSGTVSTISSGYAQFFENNIVEKEIITAGNVSYTGGTSIYHSNSITLNSVSKTDGFDSSYIDDLDYYTNKIETRFNGDTNNTGYYFDYVYSKGGVYVVDKNDTTNKPPYTPTSEDDSTASSGGCRISYGSWQHNCYLYSSGVHGGYQYAAITDTSTIPGGSCTSTPGRNPAKRRKINYICN